MKLLSIMLAFSMFAGVAQAENSKCLRKLNQQVGAPWSVADKKATIEQMAELHDLSDEEASLVIGLLRRSDTEAYIPYDSADAGFYIAIVENKKCRDQWSGFIYNN